MRAIRGSARVAVALTCALAIQWSCLRIRADRFFREDTPQSIRRAIELIPDDPQYYIRLSQLDDIHSVALLERALRHAPFQASAAIELGLRAESTGDYSRSEKLLLQAFEVDRTYVPRWTLANFYFRRKNLPAFWNWARRAAEMPADDIGALFELCWRVTPDGESIARVILTGDPSALRQYLVFLLAKNETRIAAGVARQLIERGGPRLDRTLLLSLVDRLIAQNERALAYALWRFLDDRRWIVADRSLPNNPNFARPPLPVAFDWRFPSVDGLHSSPGPSGLEVEFSGKQPERCLIAEQTVLLPAGQYTFVSRYRTVGISPETGLGWRLSGLHSGLALSKSLDLSSEKFTEQETRFSVEGGDVMVSLQLEYRRAIGTTRISGILVVTSTAIRADPAHDLSKMR